MNTNVIATFANADYGIEAIVAQISSGYSVAIKDVDADEIVPICIIYSTAEAAISKAKAAVA